MYHLLIVTEALHYAACMLLMGGMAFRYYAPDWTPPSIARPTWLIRAATMLALLTAAGWLALETGMMGGGWDDVFNTVTIGRVLSETQFGTLWGWRLVLAAVVNMLAWSRMRRVANEANAEPASDVVLLLLSCVLLASLGGIGHAVDGVGVLQRVQIVSQGVHLLAAGAWLGGLPPLLRALGSEPAGWQQALLRRFSLMGMGAVALLLVTGIADTVLIAGAHLPELPESQWGQALMIKLVMVVGLVGVAAWNRFVLMPKAAAGLRPLARSVVIEQVLGMMILFTAAWLGSLSPPGH